MYYNDAMSKQHIVKSKSESRWRRLLRYRMAYGEMIPPEARVDPEAFSEEEFPVFCPDCDYLLRGLPDGRCPECGRYFERGRLLVEQYAIEAGKRYWKRTSKYAKWTSIAGFTPLIAFWLFCFLTSLIGPEKFNIRQVDLFFQLMPFLLGMGVLATILLFISGALYIRLSVVSNRNCKKVFNAIDRSDSVFTKAKRYSWILRAVCAIFAVAVIAWVVLSDSSDFRYYWRKQLRIVIPISLALIVGAILFLVLRIYKRTRSK